jgi:hypothetical protein
MADIPANRIDATTRTAQERHRTRLSRLQSLLDEGGTNIDEDAAIARDKIWGKQQPALIRVRQGLVLRLGRDVSPIRAVAASKSAAVQLLLLAIFENQCRPVRRHNARTPVPLQDADQQTGTAWRHLVALPTTDRQTNKTEARSPEVNRVAQIKSALDRLKKLYRVDLNLDVKRGRYENFELLNEATNNQGGSIRYKAPTPDEATIDIPVSFFMNGWIHALADNEIIAYLFLLHQAKISRKRIVTPGCRFRDTPGRKPSEPSAPTKPTASLLGSAWFKSNEMKDEEPTEPFETSDAGLEEELPFSHTAFR